MDYLKSQITSVCRLVRRRRARNLAPVAVVSSERHRDQICLDLRRHGRIGNEVARRVHAVRPAVPVLYMSGYYFIGSARRTGT
jgi:DNA-binding NtrC family response regulator